MVTALIIKFCPKKYRRLNLFTKVWKQWHNKISSFLVSLRKWQKHLQKTESTWLNASNKLRIYFNLIRSSNSQCHRKIQKEDTFRIKEWAFTNFNWFLTIKFHWNFPHYKNPALKKKRSAKIRNSIKQQLVESQTLELINKILKLKLVHLIKILRQTNFLHKQDKIRRDLLLTRFLS